MTPQEIAFCYKKRWDIEVYFKFLKQNLNFSHFLSTNENGIKVILYMTIITSMLVMIYKKENELGFSIAKFNFYLEMQEWVGALLVVINGGDLSNMPKIIFQPLMISNPPGRLVGLRSWRHLGTLGLLARPPLPLSELLTQPLGEDGSFRHLLYLLPSFRFICFWLSCSRFSSSPLSSS